MTASYFRVIRCVATIMRVRIAQLDAIRLGCPNNLNLEPPMLV